jgi:putative nucleotidyltransferase with HDIG domain
VITLDELTQEVQDLAPLPAAAAKLAQIVSSPDPDVNAAVTAIRFDEALTARILRFANSPFSGPRSPIRNVRDAVVRLGLAKVFELAVRGHVRGEMSRDIPEYGLGEEEMWRHSVASALTAEILVRAYGKRIPPIAFTAALLHDIGKLVLARHLEAPIQKTIQKLTADYALTYYQAEIEVLGFSHAALGQRIAQRWNLGDEIDQAIAEHHETGADRGPITDVVRIGNLVAKTVGCGLGFEGMNLTGDPGACERLGIDREVFESVSAEVISMLQSIEELHS